MKLMIITQEVDEKGSVLGFFVRWIKEFAKHFKEVVVVYFKGSGAKLSKNTKQIKIRGNKISKVLSLNRVILEEKPDSLFIHMCPEFLVASIFAKTILRIPAYLWYMHKSVPLTLRIAEVFSEKIFTGNEESFRMKTKKKIVLHHGIDTSKYYSKTSKYLLDVARISKIKNHDLIIRAFSELPERIKKRGLWIVGGGDLKVEKELKKLTKELRIERQVKFLGSVPHKKMPRIYANCSLFVSASETGSLDKTGLEAIASEKPVLICNEAFSSILEHLEKYCFFKKGDVSELSKKMKKLLEREKLGKEIGSKLRKKIKKEHSVTDLIKKIAKEIRNGRC
ncbi:glycosyltransferase [Candidatus Micrarchaeota archaeon]|nr:glycosyltransferase [Candidatus Micrarchaeota archaeon]